MGISRRKFLVGTAKAATLSTALGSAGIYELVDVFSGPRLRIHEAAAVNLPPEQHLLQQVAVIPCDSQGKQVASNSTGVAAAVLVPPLHSQIVTAKINVPATASDLQQARQLLESTLQNLETTYASS